MRRWIDAANTLAATLTEGVVGPYLGTGSLWHGTDLLGVAAILNSDYLSKSIDTDNPAGASLTFDEPMAWSFADRSSDIFMNNHYYHLGADWPHGPPPSTGGVLEFDADRLRHRYKLIAYRDDEQDDEKEVRVLGDRIAPVSQFLLSVRFHPADAPWFAAYLGTAEAREDWHDPEAMAALILRLHRHPKFRPS